jgi:hypothetical protein
MFKYHPKTTDHFPIVYRYECGLVHEMLKSARYHIDREEIVVLPQNIATTACFIQEESWMILMIPFGWNNYFCSIYTISSTLCHFVNQTTF